MMQFIKTHKFLECNLTVTGLSPVTCNAFVTAVEHPSYQVGELKFWVLNHIAFVLITTVVSNYVLGLFLQSPELSNCNPFVLKS